MICKYCGAGLYTFHSNEETGVCSDCWNVLHPRLLAALTARMMGMLMEEKAAVRCVVCQQKLPAGQIQMTCETCLRSKGE